MVCHIDIETFSEINLTKVGVYRYAEHPSTEILVVCFAFDDLPVCTWVPLEEVPTEIEKALRLFHHDRGGTFMVGTQVPFDLAKYIREGGELRAHHAAFERTLLNGSPGQAINFPTTTIEQWVCTAAKVAAHSLPRRLGDAASALKTPHQKSAAGRMVMLQLCKPRKHQEFTRWTPENAPDKFIGLYQYCVDDVETERAIDYKVPDISPDEQQVWVLDQEINERGVMIDIESVENAIFLIEEYKARLWDKCVRISGFPPSQTAKLAEWIRKQGVEIANLQAPTIDKLLGEDNLPGKVRDVLRIRRLHEMKAVSKFEAMQRAICSDSRIRGMFMYHGAGTGRWAGLIVQLQNLYRGDLDDPDMAVEIFRERDLDLIGMLFQTNPMRVLSSTVRSMIIAPPGKKLLCMDYASIEGRVLAWLAQSETKLEIFRSHGLVYEFTGADIFRLPSDQRFLQAMKRDYPEERFLGKTGELACGYQGGWHAFKKMAKQYQVDIPKAQAMYVVERWRQRNLQIVKFWSQIEQAAGAAVSRPGRVVGLNGLLEFFYEGDFLYMRLPSGRCLAYYQPVLDGPGQLTYMGINTYTRQWCRVDTYGGRLTENAVQAVARDILVNGLQNLDMAGYDIVAHVHDEVLIEDDSGDLETAVEIMCEPPTWGPDIPIKAEGFIADRYRKD